MYVYKVRPLSFMESLDISTYFIKPMGLATWLAYDNDNHSASIKPVLNHGLLVAQKFGCTEEDALKRTKYADVYITFLTDDAKTWLLDPDHQAPILYWKYNDITFILSEQKLKWLDGCSMHTFGIVGPNDKIFPSQEALNEYMEKKAAQVTYTKEYERKPKGELI